MTPLFIVFIVFFLIPTSRALLGENLLEERCKGSHKSVYLWALGLHEDEETNHSQQILGNCRVLCDVKFLPTFFHVVFDEM